ncbi:MAG: energy transducer TonB [Cytophagaceae bacterium]|nr:energy transducer TonB [Cytophagaceae bacterium]
MKVETKDAAYVKGDGALDTLLSQTIKYTEEAKKQRTNGEVMISFYVEADGSLSNFRILSDPGNGCGESVKAALEKLKFNPALVNGTPMRSKVLRTVPVYAH